jgi:hypothetical protein
MSLLASVLRRREQEDDGEEGRKGRTGGGYCRERGFVLLLDLSILEAHGRGKRNKIKKSYLPSFLRTCRV